MSIKHGGKKVMQEWLKVQRIDEVWKILDLWTKWIEKLLDYIRNGHA
jgi:hypothetical protein